MIDVDILTGGNLLAHLLVSSFVQGKGWGKGGEWEHYFIRVHENLEQHPSNNISIVVSQENNNPLVNNLIAYPFLP